MKMRSLSLLLGIFMAIPAAGQTPEPNPLKITGYLQPQYVHDDRTSQFSLRRGRIKFTYQAGPSSRFVVQPDFSSSGVVLKDGYAEFVEPWSGWKNTLTAGQFTWPFGYELQHSSSRREMPERSLAIRTLFPGERDRGVMLSGSGFSSRFAYRLAVVNGTGTTQSSDANRRKDVVGRIGFSLGPVDLGLSAYRGADLVSLAGMTAGAEFPKQRSGVDFQWTTPVKGLQVRGEYIDGEQPPAAGALAATARSAGVTGWNLYVVQKLAARHELAVRADQYDPETGLGGNATRTVGASYQFHWDRNSKVMFAFELPRRERDDVDDDVLTMRYQYSF